MTDEASANGNTGNGEGGVAVKLGRKDFQANEEVRWCPGCGDYSILANVQLLMPDLGVKPENVVKTSAAQLKAFGVKTVARTHALWDFKTTQAFPKAAQNVGVLLQFSTVEPPSKNDADWTDWREISFAVVVTATGDLSYQWAQNASSGNNTTLQAESGFRIRKIS